MTNILKPALWGLSALLSVMIALYSYRYLFGVGLLAPNVMANLYHRPWLYVHAGGGATALLMTPLQMAGGPRRRFPSLHRWTGRVYALGCLVGGLGGLICAFGTTSGPVATLGFGGLAVAWLTTTTQGWRFAVARQFGDHRAWMIRSFSLTFSAVTLRLYLPTLPLLGLTFEQGYVASSYLAWIPNLIIAELYLRGAFRARVSAQPAL